MAAENWYLLSAASGITGAPTGSRLLSKTPAASLARLGRGRFAGSAGGSFPGNTNAGQWNPGTVVADDDPSIELNNAAGSAPSTNRQGWCIPSAEILGKTLVSVTVPVHWYGRGLVGVNRNGRLCFRFSVVTAAGSAWTTVVVLTDTRITGEESHSDGQLGWRDNDGGLLNVQSAAGGFDRTVELATSHTFEAGEHLLIEWGFCDEQDGDDVCWAIDTNAAHPNTTYITLDFEDAVTYGELDGKETAVSTEVANLTGIGALAGRETATPTDTASLTATGALAGRLLDVTTEVVALSGSGALAARDVSTAVGQAALAGTGALAGRETDVSTARAVLQGIGALAGYETAFSADFADLTGIQGGNVSGYDVAVEASVAVLTGRGALFGWSLDVPTDRASFEAPLHQEFIEVAGFGSDPEIVAGPLSTPEVSAVASTPNVAGVPVP